MSKLYRFTDAKCLAIIKHTSNIKCIGLFIPNKTTLSGSFFNHNSNPFIMTFFLLKLLFFRFLIDERQTCLSKKESDVK